MIKVCSNATVNGFQYRAFKKKDGKVFYGYNVHFGYPLTGDQDKGYGTGVVYVSADYVRDAGLDVGSPINVCKVGFGKDFHYEIME